EFFEESLDLLERLEHDIRGLLVVHLDGTPEVEPLLDLLGVDAGEVGVEDAGDRLPDELAHDDVRAFELALVLELYFSGNARQCCKDVAYARHDERLIVQQSTALCVRDHELHGADRQALRDAGALVDFFLLTRNEGDLLDDLADVVRDVDALNLVVVRGVAARGPGLLLGDGDGLVERLGVVRANLGTDAVLERSHNFASSRVVLGVRGENDRDIEIEADRITLNLDVALLHDVEESHLDLAGEIGKFVDGEDAAVGARQQAVVHSELAAELVAGARGLDGIDIADEVGDGDVRRGELFDVALDGRHPGDGRVVAERGDEVAGELAQRSVGVVAQLGAGDVGRAGVEQRGESAQDA